jgi:uncharacterized iron-regulated membrane protein
MANLVWIAAASTGLALVGGSYIWWMTGGRARSGTWLLEPKHRARRQMQLRRRHSWIRPWMTSAAYIAMGLGMCGLTWSLLSLAVQ